MLIDWNSYKSKGHRPGVSDGSGGFRDRREFEGYQSPPLSSKISLYSAFYSISIILLAINFYKISLYPGHLSAEWVIAYNDWDS